MNVLMLGWEYPPHISGGLGTACEGLTLAIADQGVHIQFVMPHVSGDEITEHMTLVDVSVPVCHTVGESLGERRIRRHLIPALLNPYWTEEQYAEEWSETALTPQTTLESGPSPSKGSDQYGNDIFSEVMRFTENTLDVCRDIEFDLIHAHDWMTFPAGVALQRMTGKPLVVHVHSLECDRSGTNGINRKIHELEAEGISSADAVIAVSHYTKGIICRQHGVDPDKVHVVHNGLYPKQLSRHNRSKLPDWTKHVVLFLGRVTFQKGPDYFVDAAAKVLPHVPGILFVLAGDGDMLDRMKRRVDDLGIADHFYFPGFLRGKAVEEMFSVANLYVMPSVSEPFGISALEAINFNVPVLVSKQSGVSEVVNHSLKFDFWDVDRLANLIINGLLHDELRADMVDMARGDLERLRWDASAAKTITIYQRLLG